MYVTITLNSGLGVNLGPNFNLTADVGSVTPSTATKSELLAGKEVQVNASATQVTVTSTGACTNSVTINISGQTTTTTTAAPAQFTIGFDSNNAFTSCVNRTIDPRIVYAVTGATLGNGVTLYYDQQLTSPVILGFYSDGTNWYRVTGLGGTISSNGSCATTSTTTTTGAPTTTSTSTTSTSTTTGAPTSTTTTTLAPATFSLRYSTISGGDACYQSATTYYAENGSLLQDGTVIYTNGTLTTLAPAGWYSDGTNYWYVSPTCFEYDVTNGGASAVNVEFRDCDNVTTIITVAAGTTENICASQINELNGCTTLNKGVGICDITTDGILTNQTACPGTSTTTSTSTSTSTSTTSTSTSTTSTSTSTSTTQAPTTSTSTSTSTTSTTTGAPTSTTTTTLAPNETTTTTTSAPTTTSTSTTSTSTTSTSTTQAPTTTSTSTSTTSTTTNAVTTHLRSVTPQNSAANACAQSTPSNIYTPASTSTMAVNDVLYSDITLSTLFNGNSEWYKIVWKGAVGYDDVYAVQINSSGVVLAWEYCPSTTTTTTSTSTSTTTTEAPTTTSTSTSTTSTSTTSTSTSTSTTTTTTAAPPEQHTLNFSTVDGLDACAGYGPPCSNCTIYYTAPGQALANGVVLYTSYPGTTAPDGYYSNGSNWWQISGGLGALNSQTICPGTTTTSTSTTSTSTSTSTTTTTTTTAAPQCNYDGLTIVCDGTTTTTTTEASTTTTTAGASATLNWSFSEVTGGNGIYDLYINAVSVETRNSTASGTYTVYVGDVISVGCNADQCTGGGSTYTNIQVTGEITDAACQNNGSIPSYVSPGYTVVSGDVGTNLYMNLQVSCDGACI